MAIPSAELIITPEVSQTAIKKMQKDFDNGFDKVSKDADKAIEKGVSDGIKGGVKKSRGAFGNMSANLNKGAKAAGAAFLGILGVGFQQVIARAEEGAQTIQERLLNSTAATQIATAENAGFTLEEFGAFTRTLQKGGFREQQDINDIIFDIQERTADAETGGNPLLKQFVGLEGTELINSVLASISQLDGNKQSLALAELGFTGETGQNLLNVMQRASDGGTLDTDQTFENLNNANKSEGELIAENLRKEAELSQSFRESFLKQQDEQNRNLIEAISGESIKVLLEKNAVENERQLDLTTNFAENQDLAIDAQKSMQAALDASVVASTSVAKHTEGIFNYLTTSKEERNEERSAELTKGLKFRALGTAE